MSQLCHGHLLSSSLLNSTQQGMWRIRLNGEFSNVHSTGRPQLPRMCFSKIDTFKWDCVLNMDYWETCRTWCSRSSFFHNLHWHQEQSALVAFWNAAHPPSLFRPRSSAFRFRKWYFVPFVSSSPSSRIKYLISYYSLDQRHCQLNNSSEQANPNR